MLADFLLTAYELRWFLLGCGVLLVTLGVAAIVMRRTELVLGPDPVIPPVHQPQTFTVPSPPAPPNYRRPDSDTGVVPRTPGATPQAGPVCPVCGGPWHALCPSAPKERTEETTDLGTYFAGIDRAVDDMLADAVDHPSFAALAAADETVEIRTVDLPPQFVALSRFFAEVDEARADTDQAMGRLVDDLAGRDDCPLTTQEIPPLLDAPLYEAASERLGDTRELGSVMKKVSAP